MKLAPALYLNVSEHLNITSSIIHKSMESFHWPCKWMLTPNWLEWKCMAARDWSSTCWISYMGTCHLSALITANIFRHLTVDFFFFFFHFFYFFWFFLFFFFFWLLFCLLDWCPCERVRNVSICCFFPVSRLFHDVVSSHTVKRRRIETWLFLVIYFSDFNSRRR